MNTIKGAGHGATERAACLDAIYDVLKQVPELHFPFRLQFLSTQWDAPRDQYVVIFEGVSLPPQE